MGTTGEKAIHSQSPPVTAGQKPIPGNFKKLD
jgi:hypothetical protein